MARVVNERGNGAARVDLEVVRAEVGALSQVDLLDLKGVGAVAALDDGEARDLGPGGAGEGVQDCCQLGSPEGRSSKWGHSRVHRPNRVWKAEEGLRK